MTNDGAVVVVGGTRAIGLEIGKHFAARGDDVVLTGQDPASVEAAVAEARGLGRGRVDGATFDLSAPETIAPALAGVGTVRHLVLAAIDRDANSIKDYDIGRAIRLATLKLVGYPEVVHALLDRLPESSSLVLFGGMAKERPYPGSTTVSSVNGGVVGLTRSLVEELRPRRVNSIPPRHRQRQPLLGGEAGGGRELPLPDPDRAARDDGGRRRRDRVPPRESVGERRRSPRRCRLALSLRPHGRDHAGPRPGPRRLLSRP